MDLILLPSNNGSVVGLTAVPGGRNNFECVYDYPDTLDSESYVYMENGVAEDLYVMSDMQATQRLKINSVSVRANCERENDTQVCSVKCSIRPTAVTARSHAVNLTESFVEYSGTWNINPESDLFWTIADVNAMEAGAQLISGGAGCEAMMTQLYAIINVSVLGEYVTNYSPFFKDIIHVNQGFSVIASEENARSLFGATTVQIKYKDPNGTTGNITGDIVDNCKIIAPVTAALNNTTGKWWFKLYAELAGGEILEGKPFFTNVVAEWL